MHGAIYAGLMHGVVNPSPGPSLDIVPTCPSGNCTFPSAYSTLAVCSMCSNITSAVVYTSVGGFGGVNATLPHNVTLQMPDNKLLAITGHVLDTSTADRIPGSSSILELTIIKLGDLESRIVESAEAAQCSLVRPAANHCLPV